MSISMSQMKLKQRQVRILARDHVKVTGQSPRVQTKVLIKVVELEESLNPSQIQTQD
jgi:hypothetical protein